MASPIKTLLTVLLFCCGLHISAQNLSTVKSQLATLSATAQTSKHFDSLFAVSKKNLLAYLEHQTLSESDSIPILRILHSPDGKMHAYTFHYLTGNNDRSLLSRTVVQWKKPDGSYATHWLDMEADFYEIHRLPAQKTELYLLTGAELNTQTFYQGFALVLQVNNNQVVSDYPAFFGKYSMVIYLDDPGSGDSRCIACIEYCEKCQAIKINGMGQGDALVVRNANGFKTKIEHVEKISLKFDGKKFQKE